VVELIDPINVKEEKRMNPMVEYKKTEISTADRIRIINLLYEGAINFIRIARERLQEGDIPAKGLFIGKATSVVGELANALDMEAGGEVAQNLARLYNFVLDRLLRANARNETPPLDEAERVLQVLSAGWKELERRRPLASVVQQQGRSGGGMECRI
jgi:flagellar protein FliS